MYFLFFHIAETPFAGVSSVMSVLSEYAVVKKETLWEVVGNNKYKVNNLLDHKYKPREISMIVKEAHSLVDSKQPYSIISQNCEHFVTGLRYGKSHSRQVGHTVLNIHIVFYINKGL